MTISELRELERKANAPHTSPYAVERAAYLRQIAAVFPTLLDVAEAANALNKHHGPIAGFVPDYWQDLQDALARLEAS